MAIKAHQQASESFDIKLRTYDISRRNGFLPTEHPLLRLDDYYQPWELIATHLPLLVREGTLRTEIDKLPILSTSKLVSKAEWQRAYSVLGFLVHSYIWGGKTPSEKLPASIAVPMLEIAAFLELPPTATYAGLNLWNWAVTHPGADLTNPDNLISPLTFTGTADEAWFYLISVAMEARGGEVISRMLKMLDAVEIDDSELVTAYLLEFVRCINDLGDLLERMYEKCEPTVFFYQIRPFLAGSKGMAKAGLPRGVFYDEGEGKGRYHMYSGGSNAQSSLLQFFDILLGVEHRAVGNSEGKENPFIKQMRDYMPGPHRRFLEQLTTVTNIRPYAQSFCPSHPVTEAYNAAVRAYSGFRDKHLKLVARYIINPARKPSAGKREAQQPEKLNLATVTVQTNVDDPENGPSGTGGTALMPFLKQTRDETRDAAVLA